MKLIDISSKKYPNTFTMVDDEDAHLVSGRRWYVSRGKRNNTLYVVGRPVLGGPPVKLHRHITGAAKGMLVDHKDFNGLNNTRGNLRVCSAFENQMNTKKKACKSGIKFKGIWKDPTCTNKFRAAIRVGGKRISLGSFSSQEEAALAYNDAAVKHYGEFAHLNNVIKSDAQAAVLEAL